MRPIFVRLSEKRAVNLALVQQFHRTRGAVLRLVFAEDGIDLTEAEAEAFLAAARVYEFAPGGVNPPSPETAPDDQGW